ncbi:MAG: CPBP family intramembrane glutamic endopeptidase [Candidatus Omnitrophota bacterium]
MKCPYCGQEISNNAIRCKYCRRSIKDGRKRHLCSVGRFFFVFKKRALIFLVKGRNVFSCPWTLWDVLVFVVLMGFFVFYDPLNIGPNIVRFLRVHSSLVVKEPKLLYYSSVYISTIVFKIISLIFLLVLIRSKKRSFNRSILFAGELPDLKENWMPLYIGICIILCLINGTNPLVPDIPFNSVFPEARIIGNIVIIFSALFVAPFIEEVLFRGFLYPALNKYFGMYVSIILTSLLFTLAHYPQIRDNAVFMAALFVLGVIITYAKAKTGSTILAIVMHHLYNLVCISAGFFEYFLIKYRMV